ncbi:unnamed protein product [Dimorphilus gyrociliatus]|uniref:Uncharacterized protein n=1 Tax=Dimorphilus gyrociliatus TaxID=2664684 RepID=A0A7I8VCR2_9ANNE|nr:unnamed protein product [Dimorphilus gyrociliatus]
MPLEMMLNNQMNRRRSVNREEAKPSTLGKENGIKRRSFTLIPSATQIKSEKTMEEIERIINDRMENLKAQLHLDIIESTSPERKIKPTANQEMLESLDNLFAKIDEEEKKELPRSVHMLNVPNPKKVFASGSGLASGIIGERNRFQVHTSEFSGNGWLSVGIQGPKRHSVQESIITYTGDGIYEISYVVNHPGLYNISVKWAQHDISNGPFLCEILLE